MGVETADPEIADVAVDQMSRLRRNGAAHDFFAPEFHAAAAFPVRREQFEFEFAACRAVKKFHALFERQRLDLPSVDAVDLFAGQDARFVRRTAGKHRRDQHRSVFHFDRVDADAGLFAGAGLLVDGEFRGRLVPGIGVELTHHAAQRGFEQPVVAGFALIDIVPVQELHDLPEPSGLFVGRSSVKRFRF